MKKRSWNICNVITAPAGARTLWKFAPDSRGAKVSGERRLSDSDKLPSDWVNKGLSTLFGQSKINVGWLRHDQIFTRVVRLPASDPLEIHSMIDLQLEKLSPLAVGQMAWTFELIGPPIDGLQTVVVVIVERRQIDAQLNSLQSTGFLADKLDIPFLRELVATKFDRDGVWVFLGIDGNPGRCLTAWHFEGSLQSVNLLNIGEGEDRPKRLFEQLNQTLWSGEVEGWLASQPIWNLVGTESSVAFWQPKFESWSGSAVTTSSNLRDEEIASLTASHAGDLPPEMTLVPPEFAMRYRQALIDRTWMSALAALAVIYIVVVGCYIAFLEYHRFRLGQAQTRVDGLKAAEAKYQGVVADKIALLKQRDLRKAAIRTLRAAAENLPADLTLTKLTLQGGKSLNLFGTAPSDQSKAITEYADAMGKALDEEGNKLFATVALPNSQNRPGTAGLTWSFACEIATASQKEIRR